MRIAAAVLSHMGVRAHLAERHTTTILTAACGGRHASPGLRCSHSRLVVASGGVVGWVHAAHAWRGVHASCLRRCAVQLRYSETECSFPVLLTCLSSLAHCLLRAAAH